MPHRCSLSVMQSYKEMSCYTFNCSTLLEPVMYRLHNIEWKCQNTVVLLPNSENVPLYLVFQSPLSTPLHHPSGCDYWLWPNPGPCPFFTQWGGPAICCLTHLSSFTIFHLSLSWSPFSPWLFFFSLIHFRSVCFNSCSSPLHPTAAASVTN